MGIISKINNISAFFVKGCKRLQKTTNHSSPINHGRTSSLPPKITESPKISIAKNLKNLFNHAKYNVQRLFLQSICNFTGNACTPYLKNYISKNFDNIKKQLLKLDLDKETLKKIENSASSQEIANIIKSIKYKETMKLSDVLNLTLLDSAMPEHEKLRLIKAAENQYNTKMLNLEKALSCPSVDPKVIEIEEILKKQYGMEFVSLKDDYEHAQKLLKACKLMKENRHPLPKNYIISNMLSGTGQCLQTESTVLHLCTDLDKILNPKTKKTANVLSTEDDIQTIIHEFGHNLQPEIIRLIKIPQRFKSVPKTISKYADMGSNAELWAELFAKIQLHPESVTKQQKELFEYLKNFNVNLPDCINLSI